MPPTINLEPHKLLITTLYAAGETREHIIEQLQQRGVKIGISALNVRLRDWGAGVRSKTEDTLELRERIQEIFRRTTVSDEETVGILRDEGYQIEARALQRIRWSMGLRRKTTAERCESRDNAIAEDLEYEYAYGDIQDLGRRELGAFVRRKYGHIGTNTIYTIASQLQPDGVAIRWPKQRRQPRPAKSNAIGPDHIWSLDAYCKLEHWGIQIYAAIDVWSRFMLWIYIGPQAKTKVSTFIQYVQAVADGGKIPVIIRSDRGVETTLLGDAHYTLSELLREGENSGELQFTDCFEYGTSKQNQAIESWWAQQAKSSINRWRDYFQQLTDERKYNRGRLADRIAFLAVYMPIVRAVSVGFVDLWNHHRVRFNRNAPERPAGHPELLYKHGPRYGGPQQGIAVPNELLATWQEEAQDFDLDEYLPPATLQWCEQFLDQHGFLVESELGGRMVDRGGAVETNTKLHALAYEALRDAASLHIQEGRHPQLSETIRIELRDLQAPERLREAMIAAGNAV